MNKELRLKTRKDYTNHPDVIVLLNQLEVELKEKEMIRKNLENIAEYGIANGYEARLAKATLKLMTKFDKE